MVFSSSIFLFLFLPFSLLGYYVLGRRLKNIFLLLVSLFFYAWGEPRFVFIMIGSVLANHFFALLIDRQLCCAEKYLQKEQEKQGRARRRAKLLLVLMVCFNLSLFFVFKYLNFTLENLNILFSHLGLAALPQTAIRLPIGISFFTFQAMSYVFDVYYRKGEVQKNPLYTALYVSLFPQLIAGPIVRYQTVANEIRTRRENLDDFSKGVGRFIAGLAKKAIVANTIAVAADAAYAALGDGTLTVGYAWFGAIAYTLQIYFDFSGYSDMAIGLGLMFGFHFLENFDHPYMAKTVSEFWRRWHISLGSWFRDYVYIPLGGSRVKKGRLILNLFVVWGLTGVWHGANWTFLVWGLLYFVLLSAEKLLGLEKRLETGIFFPTVYRVFTLLYVICGWVIFRADTLGDGLHFIGSMFGFAPNGLWSQMTGVMIGQYAVILTISVIFCFEWKKLLYSSYEKLSAAAPNAVFVSKVVFMALLAAVSLSFTVASTYNPFIYFNF